MAFIDRRQSISVGIVSLSSYCSLPSSSSVHEYSHARLERDVVQIVLMFFHFLRLHFFQTHLISWFSDIMLVSIKFAGDKYAAELQKHWKLVFFFFDFFFPLPLDIKSFFNINVWERNLNYQIHSKSFFVNLINEVWIWRF